MQDSIVVNVGQKQETLVVDWRGRRLKTIEWRLERMGLTDWPPQNHKKETEEFVRNLTFELKFTFFFFFSFLFNLIFLLVLEINEMADPYTYSIFYSYCWASKRTDFDAGHKHTHG